jgi:hypothetical protein
MSASTHPRDVALRSWKTLGSGDTPPREDDTVAAQSSEQPAIDTFTVAELLNTYPHLRPARIEGLLRQGEVMNLVAGPKVGKTWLVHSLAISIATGKPWLGRPTRKGSVMIIDAELHEETLADRLAKTAEAMGVEIGSLSRNLLIRPRRGRCTPITDWSSDVVAIKASCPDVVILDALYRFMPSNFDENSNGMLTEIYNVLDNIASSLNACFIVVHHTSKGNQSSKAVTDVGAGGGSQSRAVDAHVVIRAHESPDALVVDAAVRSWPKIAPFVIRGPFPRWTVAPELDPSRLGKSSGSDARSNKRAPKPRTWTAIEFASEIVGRAGLIRDQILEAAKRHDISTSKAESLLRIAERERLIVRETSGPSSVPIFKFCDRQDQTKVTSRQRIKSQGRGGGG